jgi:hypothetical protein
MSPVHCDINQAYAFAVIEALAQAAPKRTSGARLYASCSPSSFCEDILQNIDAWLHQNKRTLIRDFHVYLCLLYLRLSGQHLDHPGFLLFLKLLQESEIYSVIY